MGYRETFGERIAAYLFIAVCLLFIFMGLDELGTGASAKQLLKIWTFTMGAGPLINEMILFIRNRR